MFKHLKKLFQPKRGLRADEDEIYTELCTVLQEALLPIGFTETTEEHGIGKFSKYQRDTFLVELYLERPDRFFSFFASSGVQNPISPPRQLSMSFSAFDYSDEEKVALRTKLEDWLKTIKQE